MPLATGRVLGLSLEEVKKKKRFERVGDSYLPERFNNFFFHLKKRAVEILQRSNLKHVKKWIFNRTDTTTWTSHILLFSLVSLYNDSLQGLRFKQRNRSVIIIDHITTVKIRHLTGILPCENTLVNLYNIDRSNTIPLCDLEEWSRLYVGPFSSVTSVEVFTPFSSTIPLYDLHTYTERRCWLNI